MKKILNFRPIVIFSLCLVLGGYLFAFKIKYSWLIYPTLFALLCCVGIGVVILIKHKTRKRLMRLCLLVVIPVLIGGLVVEAQIQKRFNTVTNPDTYLISGKVIKGGTLNEQQYITLEDVTLEGGTLENKTKIPGQVKVKVFNDSNTIYSGDKVSFVGKYKYVYKEYFENQPINAGNSTAEVCVKENLNIVRGSGIKYNVLKWSKKQLDGAMNQKEASLAYSMLFGDKTLLDGKVKDNFSETGLAHVLAVSGLHVGFISLLVGFFLKIIIKNKWAYSSVLVTILIGYAYLCGFSASIVRAIIMSAMLMIAQNLGDQYDGLNALGFAGLVNFIINPLCVFNVGFLLSFIVVLSILGFAPPIKYHLEKRMPAKTASAIAVAISAWLGGILISLFYFKKITLLSSIFNLLLIPSISIIFMILMVALLISLIPILGEIILDVPEILLKGLNKLVELLATLHESTLRLPLIYFSLVVGMVGMIISTDYVFIRKKWAYAGVLTIGVVLVSLVANI